MPDVGRRQSGAFPFKSSLPSSTASLVASSMQPSSHRAATAHSAWAHRVTAALTFLVHRVSFGAPIPALTFSRGFWPHLHPVNRPSWFRFAASRSTRIGELLLLFAVAGPNCSLRGHHFSRAALWRSSQAQAPPENQLRIAAPKYRAESLLSPSRVALRASATPPNPGMQRTRCARR